MNPTNALPGQGVEKQQDIGAWTPGPWSADMHNERQGGGRFYVFITATGLVPVCAVTSGVEGYGREEGRANARLIAAAPEMFAALVDLLAPLEAASAEMQSGGFVLDEYAQASFDRARAALKKASGK